MHIYRCTLFLQDYLFFATTERGKVAETGPFIHNYALTYAFGWATGPWHHQIQKPRYQEDLALVGQRYITPAHLVQGQTIVMQYNTMSEEFHSKKQQSIGYPEWGFLKCFRPGSKFCCYIVSKDELIFPHFIRLGKFMAKTRVIVTPALKIEQTGGMPTRHTSFPLLNWNDLPREARPAVFDILAHALPSHLIANPVFRENTENIISAVFEEERNRIRIPLHMGYYGENLCASW